jgi:hypothetical protein
MKRNNVIVIITLAVLLTILLSCGGDEEMQPQHLAASYLPEKSIRADLDRASDIRTFVGDSLWEYIDGGAEVYHSYNFVEVATADYKNDNVELVADIYRFDTPTDAFGLYSMLRQEDIQTVNLGVEGFVAPASVNFVKGEYLVRLTAYEDSEVGELALINMAEELSTAVPGTTAMPAQFDIFPTEGIIPATDKYYAEQFLGQNFLTRVFTRNYRLDSDTVTLFWTADSTGGKFLKWRTYADNIDLLKSAPDNLPFDENYSFIQADDFYGDILIGLKMRRLVGMVNYSDEKQDFFKDWLDAI